MLMADQGDDYLFAERFGLESIYDLNSYHYVEKKIHKLPYPFVKEKLALPIDEKEGKKRLLKSVITKAKRKPHSLLKD